MSLLETSALWLSRADLLGDPFEGSVSAKTIRMRDEWIAQMLQEIPNAKPLGEVKAMFVTSKRSMITAMRVSCWHRNEHESAAMWRLYTTRGQGIAINTTYARLLESVNWPQERCHAGLVHHVDYGSPHSDEPDSNTIGTTASPSHSAIPIAVCHGGSL